MPPSRNYVSYALPARFECTPRRMTEFSRLRERLCDAILVAGPASVLLRIAKIQGRNLRDSRIRIMRIRFHYHSCATVTLISPPSRNSTIDKRQPAPAPATYNDNHRRQTRSSTIVSSIRKTMTPSWPFVERRRGVDA